MTSDDSSVSRNDFKFPECWSNDLRMSALFAPFRSKSVNPTDWTSKMKFWTDLIENWCKHNKSPVINISNLKSQFSRKGVVPACLEDVLQHLNNTRVLIVKENFLASNESWKEWAVKTLVTNPIKWTFNTVKSTLIKANNEKEIYYIHLPVIRYLGEQLLKTIPSSCKGKLITFEDLMKLWEVENAEDLSLVLHWLQKQGLVAVCDENEHTLVKLGKNGTREIKISDTDIGIYGLEKQEKLLLNNIKKLETEKDAALEETKKHLASKMKSLAKISLRRKKEIEKTIEKRAVMLENIQGILHRIDQVKLDSEVVECYQKGIATLKRIFKETGLNEETVTSTMNELADVLESRNEIEDALSRPLDPSLDQNLEDELNELLLQDAPEVPSDSLSTDLVTEKEKEKKKKKSEETDELGARLQALNI